ncbi:uncharacterized protein CTRU02_200768 [Colletotrichum truncatum]|uniref:Uncharacterized protein n=1 Tax=Colletotrichum truncatum TaxID=5467 RepID=A0ACC3ZFJ7_COLTU
MKYTIITAFFAAYVAADATTEAVNRLAAQVPTCALTCVTSAGQSVNCGVTDFKCSCSKADQLTQVFTDCLSKSPCSPDDQTKSLEVAQQICALFGNTPASASGAAPSGAAASSAAASGVSAATAGNNAATTSPGAAAATSSKPAAAGKVEAVGWAGAIAAVAALAL